MKIIVFQWVELIKAVFKVQEEFNGKNIHKQVQTRITITHFMKTMHNIISVMVYLMYLPDFYTKSHKTTDLNNCIGVIVQYIQQYN
jgi:hypothetical protein